MAFSEYMNFKTVVETWNSKSEAGKSDVVQISTLSYWFYYFVTKNDSDLLGKNALVIENFFCEFEAELLRSQEQFIRTVKRQSNFWKKNKNTF